MLMESRWSMVLWGHNIRWFTEGWVPKNFVIASKYTEIDDIAQHILVGQRGISWSHEFLGSIHRFHI